MLHIFISTQAVDKQFCQEVDIRGGFLSRAVLFTAPE